MGRIVASCAVALLAGLAQPLLVGLSPLALALPLTASPLFAWAGPLPGALSLCVGAASVYGLYGASVTAVILTATVPPSVLAMWTLSKRVGFFQRLKWQLAAQFLSVALAALIAYRMLGMNIADAFGQYVADWLNRLTDASFQAVLEPLSLAGVVSGLPNTLTEEARQAITLSLSESLSGTLKLSLAGVALFTSGSTALLCVLWPSLVCVRRGDEPSVPYVPLYTWHVPNGAVLGALGSLILGYALYLGGVSGADALTNAMLGLLNGLLTVQAFSGVSGRLRASGMAKTPRYLLLAALLVFGAYLMRLLGLYRTFFGRRGVVAQWKKRANGKENDE